MLLTKVTENLIEFLQQKRVYISYAAKTGGPAGGGYTIHQ